MRRGAGLVMADGGFDPQARQLITPEGVDLRLRLGTVAERAMALMIDMALIVAGLIALTLAAWGAGTVAKVTFVGEAVAIIWLIGSFVARNFYFTALECGPRSATLGKRAMRLRVASRNGAALTANAVIARNAMREIELYMPLSVLFADGGELGSVIVLAGVVWCGVFLLFPLFNKDRLRAGDVIAGTWVVKTPKRALLPDLADAARDAKDARFAFTQAQLDAYGVKELQVLETVLRAGEPEVMSAVAERIRAKINWRRAPMETEAEFLSAYYAGLRRRLEQRLLFGVRKRDKHDRA
jgi:uncharacterized RDD family membrane protein YckC